jgi:hypothetical protein
VNPQIVTFDSREPWPHPWISYLPTGWQADRRTLETGDVVLAALPEGAVVERKTPADMAGCISSNREDSRGNYVGAATWAAWLLSLKEILPTFALLAVD